MRKIAYNEEKEMGRTVYSSIQVDIYACDAAVLNGSQNG